MDTQAPLAVEAPEARTVMDKAAPEDGINKETPSQDAQLGVQKIEAVTLAWTKKSLAASLINIWIIFLVNGLRGSILFSLTPFVTSDFQSHSLLTVIGVVSDAMTSAVYIPMAKLLDLWGRAEGLLIMVISATLGIILMATSHNLAMFCAAQVM
ncbi:uncharacterized protein DNG_04375 [Cephalotrichum gorgonifer]|uniref:Major facilitator superfamily (MFS) profile domain-containing protein n=1 Tax=Cephalotrichum gorgonifer TaxID=2041049 RepID=A0AAE8MWA5_9PEZI|nr:uncharacterized protein DNG_04375 [Cephalotrichum gorgonifer]